jgi:dolichol-phosphate mannosyltransferase
MKLTIVLPAYNEEQSLPPLLEKINKAYQQYGWNARVVVVNDGSKDNTLEVAKNYKADVPIEVLDLQPNRGLAGAIREGLTYAASISGPNDVIVTLDADDSQNPFLIQRMLHHISEGSDLVIASRYQHGARILGLKASRKLMSWTAGMLFRVFVGFPGVKDYTCGFRAYRAGFLQKVIDIYKDSFITQKGFGCMVEILLKFGTEKAVIHEVPMILRYDLKQGASKMNVNSTVKQTLRLLYSYKTGSLKP